MDLFETIDIPDELIEVFDSLFKDIDIASVAFNASAKGLHDAQRAFWDAVREKYPETNGYRMHFNSKEKQLICTGVEEGE